MILQYRNAVPDCFTKQIYKMYFTNTKCQLILSYCFHIFPTCPQAFAANYKDYINLDRSIKRTSSQRKHPSSEPPAGKDKKKAKHSGDTYKTANKDSSSDSEDDGSKDDSNISEEESGKERDSDNGKKNGNNTIEQVDERIAGDWNLTAEEDWENQILQWDIACRYDCGHGSEGRKESFLQFLCHVMCCDSAAYTMEMVPEMYCLHEICKIGDKLLFQCGVPNHPDCKPNLSDEDKVTLKFQNLFRKKQKQLLHRILPSGFTLDGFFHHFQFNIDRNKLMQQKKMVTYYNSHVKSSSSENNGCTFTVSFTKDKKRLKSKQGLYQKHRDVLYALGFGEMGELQIK